MDWWKTTDEANQACAAIKGSIMSQAGCLDANLVTVHLTEFTQYDLYHHSLRQRNVKCLGEGWKVHAFQICPYLVTMTGLTGFAVCR